MNKLNKIISINVLLIFVSLLFPLYKVSAATASISGSKTVNVGQSVTITASTTAGAWNLKLSGNGQSKGLVGQTSAQENQSASTSITFTPSSAGTYTFTLSGDITDYNTDANSSINKQCVITVVDPTPTPPPSGGGSDSGSGSGSGSSSSGSDSGSSSSSDSGSGSSSSSSSTEKPKNTTKPQENTETPKSDNCFLKSLSVNQGKLKPEFEKGTKNYEIVFDEGFDFSTLNNIEITAKAEDSKASVSLPKDTSVRDGDNTYYVTVYAEDSTSITYTLKLNKPEKLLDAGLRLKSLNIEQINEEGESSALNISPAFNPDVQEYSANVEENIKSLKVNAEAEENVSIEIKGADSLQSGKNDVYIYLTTEENEDVVTVYKVVVDKKGEVANVVRAKKPINKTLIFIIIGIIAILALLLTCLIIVNRKLKKENEDFEEDEESEEIKESKEDVNLEKNEEYVEKSSIKEEPKEISAEELKAKEDKNGSVDEDSQDDKKGGKHFK